MISLRKQPVNFNDIEITKAIPKDGLLSDIFLKAFQIASVIYNKY